MKPWQKPSLDWLLVLVPVAIVLEVTGGPDLAIFLTSAAAILPLAGLIGRSTEQLALHTGPRIGGVDQRDVRQRHRAHHRDLPDPR